jgi:hypothetical protein
MSDITDGLPEPGNCSGSWKDCNIVEMISMAAPALTTPDIAQL